MGRKGRLEFGLATGSGSNRPGLRHSLVYLYPGTRTSGPIVVFWPKMLDQHGFKFSFHREGAPTMRLASDPPAHVLLDQLEAQRRVEAAGIDRFYLQLLREPSPGAPGEVFVWRDLAKCVHRTSDRTIELNLDEVVERAAVYQLHDVGNAPAGIAELQRMGVIGPGTFVEITRFPNRERVFFLPLSSEVLSRSPLPAARRLAPYGGVFVNFETDPLASVPSDPGRINVPVLRGVRSLELAAQRLEEKEGLAQRFEGLARDFQVPASVLARKIKEAPFLGEHLSESDPPG